METQYFLLTASTLDAFLPLMSSDTAAALHQADTYAIGAACDGQACGVLVFHTGKFLCDILYLAVSPSLRRKGIGHGMVDFLCSNAGQTNMGVMCAFSAPDQQAPLYLFFRERWDFTVTEDTGEVCRIPLEQLKDLKLTPTLPAGCHVDLFDKLPTDMRNSFFSDLSPNNREFFRGLEESDEQKLPGLCLCVTDQSSIRAALFCHQKEGDVVLSFLCARPGQGPCLMGLLYHLREKLLRAADKVPYLWISSVTPETQKLLNALSPQRETVSRFYLASWDETW